MYLFPDLTIGGRAAAVEHAGGYCNFLYEKTTSSPTPDVKPQTLKQFLFR